MLGGTRRCSEVLGSARSCSHILGTAGAARSCSRLLGVPQSFSKLFVTARDTRECSELLRNVVHLSQFASERSALEVLVGQSDVTFFVALYTTFLEAL